MEEKNSLASGIEITQAKTEYDAACKRLLSEKIILAWLLKSCTEEFRDHDVATIAGRYIEGQPAVSEIPVTPDETGAVIRGLTKEQASLTEGNVYFDIYFDAIVPDTGETIRLIVNVEAQGNFYPGYSLVKRGIYYCGRMISAQNETIFTDSDYQKLRKVYSIWICTNPPKNRENTITGYKMTEINLIGDVQENVRNYDLLTIIMICLGKNDAKQEDILRLLNVLLSAEMTASEKKRILQDEFQIPMTKMINEEVKNMCNLSDAVEARGIEKGIALGEAKGVEKGVVLGIRQNRLESIKSLMETLHLTASDAMSALRIPESEREAYLGELAQ